MVVNALVGMIWTFVWCVTVRLAVLGCGFIVFCGCFLWSRVLVYFDCCFVACIGVFGVSNLWFVCLLI